MSEISCWKEVVKRWPAELLLMSACNCRCVIFKQCLDFLLIFQSTDAESLVALERLLQEFYASSTDNLRKKQIGKKQKPFVVT